MHRTRLIPHLVAAWAILTPLYLVALSRAADTPSADEEAAYTRSINDRAGKIVATLKIDDAAKADRVKQILVDQYRALREIQDTRDARIAEATKSKPTDATIAEAWNKVARDDASLKTHDMHCRFVSRLSVELSPDEVEAVKDGLTYGVVPITYKRYLEMLPDLTEDQKREIRATLLEAREHAMDGGSSEEKHAIFGKYKGRINNSLSKAGVDLKAAEKKASDAAKAAAPNR